MNPKESNYTIIVMVVILCIIGLIASWNYSFSRGYSQGYEKGLSLGNNIGKNIGYENGYKIGLATGNKTGVSEGKQTGYNNGMYLGTSSGYDEGYPIGYKQGFFDGNQSGFNFGYHLGHFDIESHKFNVRYPTYSEAKSFIWRDKTNERKYLLGAFTCEDYSRTAKNNAFKKGIHCYYVILEYVETPGHALIAFNTTDKGLVFFEPQTDKEMEVDIGIKYWRDNGKYRPDHDDTIVKYDLIW